jgi:uncharacterized protein YfdQ (DUF2303 family)
VTEHQLEAIQMAECDTAAAVAAGRAAVAIDDRIAAIDHAGVVLPAYLDGAGTVRLAKDFIDAAEARCAAPPRRKGSATLSDRDSFVAYVERYKSMDTVLWAEPEAKPPKFTAVFNDTPEGPKHDAAGWRDHRAVYSCTYSPEWKAWTANEGKDLTQEAFATFIDQRLGDMLTGKDMPAPTEVLLMARQLTIRTKGEYRKEFDPTTGTGILINATEHTAESTKIHKAFLIGVPVFFNGTLYQVEARIYFRIEGRPLFKYELHNRLDVEADAFNDIRKAVEEKVDRPLFVGVPG